MSKKAMTWVWKNGPKNRMDLLVLLSLADRANSEMKAWPTRRTIAKDCRMSRRSVVRALERLEEQGYIKSKQRRKNDGKVLTSNLYTLTIDMGQSDIGVMSECHKGYDTGDTRGYDTGVIVNNLKNEPKDEHIPESENQESFSQLVQAFMEVSSIIVPRLEPRDVEAGNRMVANNITVEDLKSGYEAIKDDYTIVGLASIETAATNAMRKRVNGGDPSVIKIETSKGFAT